VTDVKSPDAYVDLEDHFGEPAYPDEPGLLFKAFVRPPDPEHPGSAWLTVYDVVPWQGYQWLPGEDLATESLLSSNYHAWHDLPAALAGYVAVVAEGWQVQIDPAKIKWLKTSWGGHFSQIFVSGTTLDEIYGDV
jgi:hypothetical protein